MVVLMPQEWLHGINGCVLSRKVFGLLPWPRLSNVGTGSILAQLLDAGLMSDF